MEINKKSTSKALFKNTGIIAIGQISTKIVNFFLLPLYTALLTTEEYGLVDLLITYAGLIAVIVGLQVFQAVFRFLVRMCNSYIKYCFIHIVDIDRIYGYICANQ